MALLTVIFEGGAQTLSHGYLDDAGLPDIVTSATYGIVDLTLPEDDSDRAIVASGTAANVNSNSTTLDAAAGPDQADPRKLSVADASSFSVGERLVLKGATGLRTVVTVDRVDTSGNNVWGRDMLEHSFASGDTLSEWTIEATFPSAEAADESKFESREAPTYAVDWTITVNSETKYRRDLIRVVRRDSLQWATVDGMLQIDQTLDARGGLDVRAEVCAALANARVAARLRALHISPWTIAGPSLDLAANYLACAIAWQQLDADGPQREQYRGEADRLLNDALIGHLPEDVVATDRNDESPAGGARSTYSSFIALT